MTHDDVLAVVWSDCNHRSSPLPSPPRRGEGGGTNSRREPEVLSIAQSAGRWNFFRMASRLKFAGGSSSWLASISVIVFGLSGTPPGGTLTFAHHTIAFNTS